jgi:demethylmenaquinone methyltransferase/2-methoxy-6-polyprenyl-1,4-benzoquinol methylase/phosphoethanolamine N-methyltransferase
MAQQTSHSAPATRGHTIRRWARFYDWLVAILSLGQRDTFRASVIERADLQPGMRVLDVGCGTGTLALGLKAAVGETGQVSGIDASPEMIEVATQKARKRHSELDLRLAVAEDLPYDDASFDRVTSTLVFHHLPDDVKLTSLREIRRVLVPGGRVVVGDFAPGSGPLLHRVLSRVMEHFGSSHGHSHGHALPLVELMQEAGFPDAALTAADNKHLEFTIGTRPAAVDTDR